MSEVKIFDETLCTLGEGPLWHPIRKSLIWFDIIEKQLLERKVGAIEARKVNFDNHVSAAGWINENELLMASSRDLVKLDIDSGDFKKISDLEGNNNLTRSNDCLLYTSPSPRDGLLSRMPSSA